jgi:uncharacterized metal-binding protein YceD (DUF177 family)
MGNPLFDRRSPRELAERGQVIETEQKLGIFLRLAGIVAADFASVPETHAPAKWRASPVQIRLKAGWADERRSMPVLEGHVSARIPAVCQRCLEPFELPVERDLRLLLTGPEAGEIESDEYETWETEEPTIRPLDIVEEALIMALPLSAMHESGACSAPEQEHAAAGSETTRPFADLKKRMRDEK